MSFSKSRTFELADQAVAEEQVKQLHVVIDRALGAHFSVDSPYTFKTRRNTADEWEFIVTRASFRGVMTLGVVPDLRIINGETKRQLALNWRADCGDMSEEKTAKVGATLGMLGGLGGCLVLAPVIATVLSLIVVVWLRQNGAAPWLVIGTASIIGGVALGRRLGVLMATSGQKRLSEGNLRVATGDWQAFVSEVWERSVAGGWFSPDHDGPDVMVGFPAVPEPAPAAETSAPVALTFTPVAAAKPAPLSLDGVSGQGMLERHVRFTPDDPARADELNAAVSATTAALVARYFPGGGAYAVSTRDVGEQRRVIEVRRGAFLGTVTVGMRRDTTYTNGRAQQFLLVGVDADYAKTAIESADEVGKQVESWFQMIGALTVAGLCGVGAVNGLGLYGTGSAIIFLVAIVGGAWAGKKIGEALGDLYMARRHREVEDDTDTQDAIDDWKQFVQALALDFTHLVQSRQT